jgi:hypothetical protein
VPWPRDEGGVCRLVRVGAGSIFGEDVVDVLEDGSQPTDEAPGLDGSDATHVDQELLFVFDDGLKVGTEALGGLSVLEGTAASEQFLSRCLFHNVWWRAGGVAPPISMGGWPWLSTAPL